MSEKLIIKNFGPIKDVELELKRFNILIGEQATGKSTVAKVLSMCRYFSYIINFDYWEKNGESFSWGLFDWGLEEFVEKNTYIYYKCEKYEIEGHAIKPPDDPWVDEEINNSTYEIKIKLLNTSPDFKKLLNFLEPYKLPDNRYSISETPISFFQNNVASVMDYPFYLPAERGVQSLSFLGKQSIRNTSNSLYYTFDKINGIINKFSREVLIAPLNIVFKNSSGNSLVKKSTHEYIKLANAATGYQSIIPIVLVIKYYSEVLKKKKTFIIEEPEQNLFPTGQYELVKFLVEHISWHNGFLITTHSPYILTSLNNLMAAFFAGQKSRNETNDIIDSKYWLNPNDVSAYMLLKNGECEDIVDREEGLIKSEKIDEVSSIINSEFNDLLNIELGIKG